MLVLTRKSEEKIVIGKDKENKITITILKIQGDKVSIGIEADKQTPIYRHELLQKDKKNAQKEGGHSQNHSANDQDSKQNDDERTPCEEPDELTLEVTKDLE